MSTFSRDSLSGTVKDDRSQVNPWEGAGGLVEHRRTHPGTPTEPRETMSKMPPYTRVAASLSSVLDAKCP